MGSIILVTTTFEERDDALDLGRHLLEKRLIGCAQVLPPVTSQYWWQGKIETAEEYRLEMKTLLSLWPQLKSEIQNKHPYDTPEIIACKVAEASEDYGNWLHEEVHNE